MVLCVLIGIHLKIFLSILRVWKQGEVIKVIWLVFESWLSTAIPRFQAWFAGLGAGLRSAGHQVVFHGEVSLMMRAIPILSL